MAIDVSVVIPTFRRNEELAEAIASVQAQASATIEILVIDDCPDGGAKPVVDSLRDGRIDYLRNPHPSGGMPSIVRNLGWPRARGRFVHFLDDDDIVPGGHYAAAIAAFARRPDVGLVFGRIAPFGSSPEAQLRHERRFFDHAAHKAALCARFGPKFAFAGQMLFDLPLLVCSASMVRRECVEGIGGFDPEIRLMEDADFHVRVMRRYGAHVLDRVTLHYRIGFPSLMHAPIGRPRNCGCSARAGGGCARNTARSTGRPSSTRLLCLRGCCAPPGDARPGGPTRRSGLFRRDRIRHGPTGIHVGRERDDRGFCGPPHSVLDAIEQPARHIFGVRRRHQQFVRHDLYIELPDQPNPYGYRALRLVGVIAACQIAYLPWIVAGTVSPEGNDTVFEHRLDPRRHGVRNVPERLCSA